MNERTAFPLSWPEGWKRTDRYRRGRARFSRTASPTYGANGNAQYAGKKPVSVADAVSRLLGELGRMGIADHNIIVSTNVELRLDGMPRSNQEPSDPGAAVYWRKSDKQVFRCMAIDRYDRVADNLAAIAATLDAMRAIERHGGAQILERAFLGFAALPQNSSSTWREVLGIQGEVTLKQVEDRYQALVRVHHPDVGGTDGRMQEINNARDAARLELSL